MKTITTYIPVGSAEKNYLQFEQDEDKTLREIIIKFNLEHIILGRDEILPFFEMMETLKKEMANL